MEIHSVLPEERAKNEKGEYLPWGYRYADSSRNFRQPEESGPFGKNRSIRYTGSRTSRTRTGTTPVKQKENTAVAEFGRLFAKEQAKEDESRSPNSAAAVAEAPRLEPEATPTECVLYGYPSKSSEWKVLSKFEKIVSPSIICEDYPRTDPNIFLSNSTMSMSPASVVVHKDLSREALKKSRVYKGGQHWIKVTFDSYQAAERACYYSPLEIDGCLVHCEIWQGKGPVSDVAIPKGSATGNLVTNNRPRTFGPASGKESAVAGFERAMTLPRSHTLPDVQYNQPSAQDDLSITSTTASSATAIDTAPQLSGLRSRSTPQLPTEAGKDPTSQYMTHIPSVKKAVLRPISEALPPQPSWTERALRSTPIFGPMLLGSKGTPGETIAEGPLLLEDGSWDEKNGWYWTFWHTIDYWLGTDFCGIKDE